MKYMKRTGIYKAANVTFDPKKIQAHSYGWWKFVDVVEGKVVFNNFQYSVTTSKHQSKVRALMNDLGIKIDIEMPLKGGILQKNESRYRFGYQCLGQTLAEMILTAEEELCDQFLSQELKKQERYERAKFKRAEKNLETYLENVVRFRDYEIKPKSQFGKYNKVAVHQIVEDVESDVSNALHNFHRDGFGNVVFYVGV